jgi:hypothetical protein
MINAPWLRALLLLRFLRLIDCRCPALSRRNRSSSKVLELNELSSNPLPPVETGLDPLRTPA